jgi:hypothetical protein
MGILEPKAVLAWIIVRCMVTASFHGWSDSAKELNEECFQSMQYVFASCDRPQFTRKSRANVGKAPVATYLW